MTVKLNMLTRRENLLIRPWQERRYINHRIKVETALPVIDNSPPASRQHVNYKMKKYQREKERCTQIVSDNFTLLQHLDYIRRTTRVDNFWDEPPPNFLNRVGIYTCRRNETSDMDEPPQELDEPKNRKDRCYGCSPLRYIVKVKIPEERIPFAPPKKKVSRKLSSTPDELKPVEKKEGKRRRPEREGGQDSDRGSGEGRKKGRARRAVLQPTQSLLLSRGPLTLRLLFPPDSGLVFNDRGQAKMLQRQYCRCAALPPSTKN